MKQFLKLVTLPIFALALSVAHASTITSAVVYQNVPDPQDASDPANWASSLPSASFTIGALGVNFVSPASGSSIADFLNNNFLILAQYDWERRHLAELTRHLEKHRTH
jgi:hypothetical protein